VEDYETQIQAELQRLASTRHEGIALAQWLKRPETDYATLSGRRDDLPAAIVEQVEFFLKYEGYVDRERRQVEKSESIALQLIPESIDYHSISALRYETREKLSAIRPRDLGQAARISGVTPADIAILSVCLKKIGPAEHRP
jgi:tRNA uridine 5-carboxymethylaminomethyl modification enzyme